MHVQNAGIDLVAYDPMGRVVLLAEAKSRGGTSAQWASRLRSNLLAHGALPQAKYFLIATPERIYLWQQDLWQKDAAAYEETAPDFIVDATKELKPYFEKFHQRPSEIGREEFEILVSSWLNNIAWSGEELHNGNSSLGWLKESGLAESLREARLEMASG
jgi:hypothetical protein